MAEKAVADLSNRKSIRRIHRIQRAGLSANSANCFLRCFQPREMPVAQARAFRCDETTGVGRTDRTASRPAAAILMLVTSVDQANARNTLDFGTHSVSSLGFDVRVLRRFQRLLSEEGIPALAKQVHGERLVGIVPAVGFDFDGDGLRHLTGVEGDRSGPGGVIAIAGLDSAVRGAELLRHRLSGFRTAQLVRVE